MANKNRQATPAEKASKNPITFFLSLGRRSSLLQLVIGWVALLLIPYAYLFLCGLVVDTWLKWYEGGVEFTAITLGLFWLINIIIGVLLTVGFAGRKKR